MSDSLSVHPMDRGFPGTSAPERAVRADGRTPDARDRLPRVRAGREVEREDADARPVVREAAVAARPDEPVRADDRLAGLGDEFRELDQKPQPFNESIHKQAPHENALKNN